MTLFKPNMTGEIVNISPIKKEIQPFENVQKEEKEVSYARTYQDIQKENFQKALKTKQEIDELYQQSDSNGIIDYEKISKLNYQLMCQSLWLSNIHRGEYNIYNNFI
jgi:hypothetical protein